MKKLLGILVVLAFAGSVCFAQEAPKAAPAPMKAPSVMSETKTMVGKVVSVTVADPAKGIANGTVSVVDETGKTMNYTVSSVAKIIDTALNTITLNQVKAGDKVRVKGKGEEAKSITLL